MSDAPSIGNILQRGIPRELREDGVRASVISLPEKIERGEKTLKIEGKITTAQEDGTVHIRTDQGKVVVKVNKSAPVQEGKNVEVTLPRGGGDPVAYIRSSPIKAKPVKVQIPPVDVPYINTPRAPALTPNTITQVPPIAVEYVTSPAFADIIYTNQIQSLISNEAFIASDIWESHPPENLSKAITIPSPLIIEEPIPHLFSPPVTDQGDIASQGQLNAFTDKIPFSHIAAKIIASPLQKPVTLNNSDEVIAHEVIQNVRVKSLSFEHGQIEHIEKPAREIIERGNIRAGETKAVIEGFTKEQHFPVLRFLNVPSDDDTRYTLKTPVQDIPSGTILNLESIPSTVQVQSQAAPNVIASTPPLPVSFFLTPETWGSLQDIQTTLHQHAPQVAQTFGNIIPSPSAPQQMGAAALFFLAAMRSGDVQSWLGEKAIDILKRVGKGDLITKLGGDMSSLARLNGESAGAEWRMLSLPMAWQNEIHKVVVHYRKEDDREQQDEKKSGGTTRFVMDLNLSNIGKVQLDGLFKAGEKRLDAILRTEQSFSQAMKTEMRRIYKDALDETEITGELSFQDTPEHWVNINAGENVDFVEDV